MKKFGIQYPVDGSSALKSEHAENIIAFPAQGCEQPEHESPVQNMRTKLTSKIMQTEVAQDLMYGSMQGKSFGAGKKWQSLLAGTCFFALAIACIYFGR